MLITRSRTQCRAFGPGSGQRYGDFTGRAAVPPTPPRDGGGGVRPPEFLFPIPPALRDQLARRLIDEDDAILLVISMLAASGTLH